MIRERQTLDLGKQIIAHIEGDGLRVLLGPIGLQEGENPVDNRKAHQGNPSQDQIMRRIRLRQGQLRNQLILRQGNRITQVFQDGRQRLRHEGGRDLSQAVEYQLGNAAIGDCVEHVSHQAWHFEHGQGSNQHE